ncbi:MAG TPA: helix-turn-helix domain-containing protein [Candidatus Blautia stercorigallinarum]|uniref:Helix-turn-helix domain-containing protein n=1 Tax=Candidatus Blautia stercorigallinarum TaxID=2838501 RepID=A0A9D1PAU2_9FIRM|nr:helix-turn-helix domain-containing protein [Candidatus Blautia stercorigallinarum]
MKLERLRGLREDSDMSQKELAEKLNISQRTLSHYETGKRDIPTEMLIKVADYFNVSVDYLLERTDKRYLKV